MPVDKNSFFRNATLKICGSLDIEKALWQCLLYIRGFMPASHMSLHLYDRNTGIAEIIAHATLENYRSLSVKIRLSEDGRKQVEEQRSIRVRRLTRAGDDAVAGLPARHIGCQDLAVLIMNLVIESEFLGVVGVHGESGRHFKPEHGRLLAQLNEPFSIAFANNIRYRELQKFQIKLEDDNRYLQNELRRISGEEVVGAEFGLKEVMELVHQVAPLDSPVLLLGETGVGKELLASAIHNLSLRREGPFIKVNCGAIPESLMDSELFGHEKGAFTGATSRKRGRFERANGGTIFLDEIGELSPEAQIRLLRVLQEKEIERVGGTETISVDIRVIAATHRDLNKMMAAGRFRDDLYFRLKVFPINIPPLRQRISDMPALLQYFIQKKCREMKMKKIPSLAPQALDHLLAYRWPGNIRELENAVERELILSRGDRLLFNDIEATHKKSTQSLFNSSFSNDSPNQEEFMGLDKAMAHHIRKALVIAKGKVEGKGGAAELLEIHPQTLRHRMVKLGVTFGRVVKKKMRAVTGE